MNIQLVLEEPDKTTKISSQLNPTLAGQVTTFLRQNTDIFAWTANDITGIDPGVIVHLLNVDPAYPPVKRKKRHFGPIKDKVIQDEVGNKWRMCIDFRDINKAYPKDFYPLSRIDQLVGSTSSHELLSLMDASQGYHQIMLNPDDQKRVSFITSG
ncbi:UNVERIFIED_CONTAM: hypothetical protein Slati_3525300 [Sesamum latifolium]|uniref:Reverse transcriptase domain-containing protein n=1 Tax=Sesamum latifolium TaxID=2727402 RepID=A0AAW2UHW7_9LAMI